MNIPNKVENLVVGAGVGGLGAAVYLKHHGKKFLVVDAGSELPLNLHNGVHYLHSVPELPFKTEFKQINLTDGILVDGKIVHEPNLMYSLQYSEKVREIQHPSSIMDVGKMNKVYMPKSNTVNTMLKDMYDFADSDNFLFGYWLTVIDSNAKVAHFQNKKGEIIYIGYDNIISTVPLDKLRAMIAPVDSLNSLALDYAPVYITNYKVDKIVPNWMINLYIPDSGDKIYRASILNGICSVESIGELDEYERQLARRTLYMFHLNKEDPTSYIWKTGKVISISSDDREKVVSDLKKMSIYIVGRFARWDRKLLIDSTISQVKSVVEEIIA